MTKQYLEKLIERYQYEAEQEPKSEFGRGWNGAHQLCVNDLRMILYYLENEKPLDTDGGI